MGAAVLPGYLSLSGSDQYALNVLPEIMIREMVKWLKYLSISQWSTTLQDIEDELYQSQGQTGSPHLIKAIPPTCSLLSLAARVTLRTNGWQNVNNWSGRRYVLQSDCKPPFNCIRGLQHHPRITRMLITHSPLTGHTLGKNVKKIKFIQRWLYLFFWIHWSLGRCYVKGVLVRPSGLQVMLWLTCRL